MIEVNRYWIIAALVLSFFALLFSFSGEGSVSIFGGNITVENLNITGDITLTDTVWDDIGVPLITGRLPSSDPANCIDTFKNSTAACSFNDGELSQLYTTIQMSHQYAEGTPIMCHIHWAPSDDEHGNVTWYLEYTMSDVNE